MRVTSYSVSLYYSGRAVLIVLVMQEEEEMVGRQFYCFEGCNHFSAKQPAIGIVSYVYMYVAMK